MSFEGTSSARGEKRGNLLLLSGALAVAVHVVLLFQWRSGARVLEAESGGEAPAAGVEVELIAAAPETTSAPDSAPASPTEPVPEPPAPPQPEPPTPVPEPETPPEPVVPKPVEPMEEMPAEAVKPPPPPRPEPPAPSPKRQVSSTPIPASAKPKPSTSPADPQSSREATGRGATRAQNGRPGAAGPLASQVMGTAGRGLGSTKPSYLSNPRPTYPPESRAAGERGTVEVLVNVNAQGAVAAASLARSSGFPRLDAAALAAVRRWRFKPATSAGVPINSSVTVPVRFEVPR